MLHTRRILSILVFSLCFQLAYSQHIFVKPMASGDGSSWVNATDLQTALSLAIPTSEIWLQKGTYYPTTCTGCSTNDRKITFQVPSDVALYGGFSGTETERTERNWVNNETILSGDINRDNALAANSYTIISFQFVSPNTIIDGFTLKDANADLLQNGHGAIENSGAAIYNDGFSNSTGSNPVIRNCNFLNNKALGFGAAIYNRGLLGKANPTIENCSFISNRANVGGGAIYNQGSSQGDSSPTIKNCDFEDNFTDFDGGAISNVGINNGNSEALIQNCTFTDNFANKHGGAIMNFGKTGYSSATIEDCTFHDNYADIGGGIYNDGTFGGQSHPIINRCTFTQNNGNSAGGAMYNLGSDSGNCNPTINSCIVRENSSGGSGAGIFNNAINGVCNPIISNCIILRNTAGTYGGGIYNLGKSGNCSPILTNCIVARNTGLSAGGMYCLGSLNGNSSPTVTNCTFYGNSAIVGGGIYCNASDVTGNSSPLIRNTIIYGNTADFGAVFRCIKGTPTIQNCLVDQPDCNSLNSGEGSNVTCGQGVLFDITPLFEDPENDNFHLMPGSPLVDSGNNGAINNSFTYDLEGNIRISNGTIDIGAYEYSSTEYIAPSFIAQPENTASCEGNETYLSVFATGTPPLTYQWKKDGINITGANNDTIYINNPTINDSGAYTCSISGSLQENIESAVASLSINPYVDAVIEVTSSTNSICPGTLVDFQINPTYEGDNPNYNWIINGMTTGVSSPDFVSNTLQDGDIVGVIYNASGACVQNNPVISNAITFEVSDAAIATIEVTTSNTVICANEMASFSVNTQNEGNNPSYQWQINGLNAGTDSATFSTMLESTDEVTCILISDAECVEETLVVSTPVSISISPLLTPEVSIVATNTVICEGQSILFEAMTENASNTATYQWQINGNNVGTNTASFESSTIQNEDLVQCTLTLDEGCLTTTQVSSNEIALNVSTAAIPSINIEANATTICEGTAIIFASVSQNMGSEPVYDWMINGVSTGVSTAIFTSSLLTNNDVITCQLVSSLECVNNTSVLSESITVNVNPSLTPDINITSDLESVCYGSPLTFTATSTNGGSNPNFEWYWNGDLIASDVETFTTSGLNEGDEIQCILTSSETCVTTVSDNSNTITPTIVQPVAPSIEVTSNDTELCLGATSVFEVDTQNAGTTPTYEWLLNGASTGVTTPNFTLESSIGGELVQCVLQSNASCLSTNIDTSSNWIVQVVDSVFSEVYIDISNDTLCDNQLTILSPIGVNSGTEPSYLWFLNGQMVSDSSSLEVLDLQNNDEVFVTMISSADCVENNVAISEITSFTVVPPLFPLVEITLDSLDDIFCPDDELVFRASTFNAGTNPSIVWLINGTAVNNNESIFSSANLEEGDVVTCEVTGTSTCVNPEAVYSNEVVISFESCLDAARNIGDSNLIKVFPNPSSGAVFIQLEGTIEAKEIQVFHANGALIQAYNTPISTNQTIELSSLSKGIYYITIIAKDNFRYTNRVVVL